MDTNCRIIRITVGDNDFTEWLEEFAKDMSAVRAYLKRVDEKDASLDEQRSMIVELDRFRELFYNTESYTPELLEELKQLITKNWGKFVRGKTKEAQQIEYLIKNFNIRIQKTFVPRWLNGEVVFICTGYWDKQWTF